MGFRMDTGKRKTNLIILSLLIILSVCAVNIISLYFTSDKANAFEYDNITIQSTNIGEMLLEGYEDDTTMTGKVFAGEMFWELIRQVTGVENPDKSTIENLDLTTPKTSEDFRIYNNNEEDVNNKDVTVTIGARQWTATYLSKNLSGEPILTLMLATYDGFNSSWHTQATNSNGNYPNNMYGTSSVRAVALNNGGEYARTYNATSLTRVEQDENNDWAIYTMDDVKGSLTSFIEVPDKMSWQHSQSAKESAGQDYNYNNDALDSGMGNFYNDAHNYESKTGYANWAEDRIWLPSVAEIGIEGAPGIWMLSENQRAADTHLWLRSAYNNSYTRVYRSSSDGASLTYGNIDAKAWGRPAFHLNLKKAAERAENLEIDAPTDVTVEYTGQALNLSNVAEEQKNWYNAEVLDLEYSQVDMIDAKLYQVKAKIKSNTIFVFKGEPDISKGESETVRVFNFTITKKKIGIEEITEVEGGLSATAKAGEVYSGDTLENGRAPTFGFTYTSTDGKGYNSDTYPTAIGAYKATVKITNECNYELDKDYDYEFSINAKEVNKPDVGLKELTYNGEEQMFSVSGMSEDAVITIPSGSGMTYLESERKLSVKNAGIYRVTVSLADNGVATQWRGGGTESYEITLTMKKATLRVDFHSDAWSWNSGIEKEIYIEDDRRSESDVLTYSLSYNDIAMDPSRIVADGTNKKRTNITMPRLANGNYTLRVTLNDTGEGKNYNYAGGTQTFSVTEREIEVNDSHIMWYYTNYKIESGAEQQVTNSGTVFQVMYNGEKYTFKVKLDSYLQENGVTAEYETNEGTAVNIFTAKVKLTSTQGLLTKTEFEFSWEIVKGKYDLSNVRWNYTDGMYKYANRFYTVELQGLPDGLRVNEITGYEDNSKKDVGSYTARVLEFENDDSNYINPIINDDSTYIYNGGTFPKTLEWRIDKGTLVLEWGEEVKTDGNGATFKYYQVKGENADKIEGYKYYRYVSGQKGEEVTLESIEVGEGVSRYIVEAILKSSADKNYEAEPKSKVFIVGSNGEEVYIDLTSEKYTYDGKAHGGELKIVNDVDFTISRVTVKYYKESVSEENILEGAPTDAGRYVITLELSAEDEGYYYLRKSVIEYEIEKKKIVAQWDTSGKSPILSEVSKEDKEAIEYEYYDGEGNLVEESQLEAGKTYTVKAKIKDEYKSNYEFVGVDGSTLNEGVETDGEEFEMKDYDPNDPNDPNNPNNSDGDNDDDGNGGALDEILAKIKDLPLWQLIASGISIILTIAFLSKTASNESKRKKAKKVMEKKYNTFYATAFLGISVTNWTVIACVLMGTAVLSLIFMVISQKRRSKAEEELEDAKEEYAKHREEMMFMRMMGGNAGNTMGQQGFAYAPQPSLGAEDIRGIVSETMTAMLPGMQQMLPQQASNNDELINKLIEQNAHNEERIRELTEHSDKRIEKLMKQLSEQKPVEKVIEREVATTIASDDTIRRILDNQDKLMEKILELSTNKSVETQVVEKIVEKPIEKVVEKEVRVEVPVEVEKIVEKEVVKEVKVEVPIEVEKVVEKIVEIPAEKPAPKAKATAPRLTLDEAYAKLSAKQKKFFDTLKEYAMSKDKCKEKKSTYYILLGQSSVNPLVKLTIKKDCTVALFKMEDEYMKDIRRNAGSEGTKVKVKETELIVGDSQALATAKEMIDLREDQIERYNDFLKEQRSLRKK